MDSTLPQLSRNQAYLAMFAFLEAHWKRSGSDDIAALLGSMSQLAGGVPADPAISADWESAVDAAVAGSIDARMQVARG
jgi:hypothetical protein